MNQFNVYQQRWPKVDGHSSVANLVAVGSVSARTASAAIEAARKLPAFVTAPRFTLAAFPIVESV